ncbi:unnamed protein product [Triticum turgidum subsp. durum]|uniref:FAS1 domain-containing protein n=1 Tax=Triticum turgidum subsp. durum TaxID=4567 RepID=A0A9R0VGJ2_TRITD|nr:unnamed protein product [Triticum turgidum subsp. durum]
MAAMQRLVLLLSVAIAASAQGPAVAPAAPTTPTTPAAPAPAAGTTNITGVLAKAGQFNTFIRLLKSTGVAAQIDNQLNNSFGSGMTVFAPTDNAFTSLASGTLNTLYTGDQLVVYQVNKVLLPMAIAGTPAPAPAPLAPTKTKGKTPTSTVADAPEAEASTDTSLAAPARIVTGGGVAVVHVLGLLACVWWGLL